MTALRVAGTLALLLAVSLALPAETRVVRKSIKRQAAKEETKPVLTSKDTELILKESQLEKDIAAANESISAPISNNDQKKVVTYILGQPGKGSLQSPAELLSPDRYEFYTFDDDGKIIKKLMNVEEIQKIIASSREGVPIDAQHNTDYYQVLTVTPDVQSLPTVKINPNEPIFSIHDVIASVQNVLKSEISQKSTQPPPAIITERTTESAAEEITPETPAQINQILEALKNVQEKNNYVEQLVLNVTTESAVTEAIAKTEQVPLVTTEAATEPAKTTTQIRTTQTRAPTTTTTQPLTKSATTEPQSTTTEQLGTTASQSTTTAAPVVRVNVTTAATTTTIKPTVSTKKPVVTTKKPVVTTKKTTVTTKKPVATTKKPITVAKKPQVTPTKAPTTTKKPTTTSEQPSTTTTTTTTTEKPSTTTKSEPSPVTEDTSMGKPTMVQVLKITSSVSQSSSPMNQLPAVTTIRTTTTTPGQVQTTIPETTSFRPIVVSEVNKNDIEILPTEASPSATISPIVVPDEAPLSILDGHPGLLSNSSFFDNSPFPDSLLTIESQLFDNVTGIKNDSDLGQTSNLTEAASALSQVQIPMNQDLAESVSSVISQIANEISMSSLGLEEESLRTTTVSSTTVTDNDRDSFTTTELPDTTILPESWLKNGDDISVEEISTTTVEPKEDTTVSPPSIKPQNKPRPFFKPTTEAPVTTTTTNEVEISTSAPNVEARTESVDASNDSTTTTSPQTTTEYIESTTTDQPEKKTDPINRLQVIESNGNTSSIEIIQEAETGRIPRPTQQPEEITTRPGSVALTTTNVEIVPTNQNNVVSVSSVTLSQINTKPSPASVPVSSSTTELPPTTSSDIETTSQAASEEELKSNETNLDDDAENISISFMPMEIKPSSVTEQPTTESLPSTTTEESLESKIIPQEEIVEKSAPSKVVIAALTEEKVAPISKDPPALHKQSFSRPQSYVKPQKPVFIKPTKGKPQEIKLEPKPSKPTRPLALEEDQRPYETPLLSSPAALELDQAPEENLGLEATTIHLEPDVRDFVELCNELAFSLWSSITHNGLSFVRSVVVSPFAVTSLLAMVFLGARGPTSGQMNDILKLDDVVTFNPHLVFRNVTESLVIARHPGVATAAFVRELYSDRSKGKLLDFYKERAQQFYDGHVEEVNFKAVGETLRRQTNHLIKRQTWGKVKDFLQGSTLMLRPPLAAFSANIFQADCSRASVKDRDGEMYFVVLPSNRLRRLVPIPAAVWRDDFLAGYEPGLDATAAAVGSVGGIVSTIFVMPGQQGLISPGDSLARLEHHLLGSSYKRGNWERLMRSLLRRPGLELQVPRLSHKSIVNVTASLQKMGLRDLFSAEKADLTGLNGLSNDLHLSDMVQVNQFSTCGDDFANSQSHSEFYPAIPLSRREKSADNVFSESIESLFAVSDFEDPTISQLPLELRPRQARIPGGRTEGRSPEPPRLRLDRPFLFFVRHNPTGLILHVGRFNPRLMH